MFDCACRCQAAESYAAELDAPVKVSYSSSRGYFLTIPASACDADQLPAAFTRAVLHAKTVSCTTEVVSALSDRAAEAIGNALTLTHELIQEIMGSMRQQIDGLFALTDCLALLDMLASFADVVALSPHPHSRPVLLPAGPLVIKAGRHAVLGAQNSQCRTESFVENDTYLDRASNVQIVTGPNGCGKTVYIKQVG